MDRSQWRVHLNEDEQEAIKGVLDCCDGWLLMQSKETITSNSMITNFVSKLQGKE